MTDVERFVRFCESSFGRGVMDREASYVESHIQPEQRVLDVGCGIGSLEARLTDHEIVGIDHSAEMVRTARDRAPASFLQGDATALPIETDGVDTVVFVSTLEFVPELDATLAEALRVLAPDGTVVALVLNTRSDYAKRHLAREGSYFQRMVHRDTDALTETILEYVDGRRDRILGIDGEDFVDRTDPSTAAVTAVVGGPAENHKDHG